MRPSGLSILVILSLSLLLPVRAANAQEVYYTEALSGEKNKMVNSRFYKMKSNSWLQKNKNKFVNVITGRPPCTSRWRGYFGSGRWAEDAQTKFRKEIAEDLRDFPQSTIKYCSQIAYIVRNGQITEHPDANSGFRRTTGSIFINDRKAGKNFSLNIIQESDYRVDHTGGRFYNENLKEVCNYKFVNQTEDIIVNCVGLGIFGAKVQTFSNFFSHFRIFGENNSFTFLASNLSKLELKDKYPELFQTN